MLNTTMEEKTNKTYLLFVIASSVISLFFVSLSPFLFFMTFSGLTTIFLFTYPKWSTLHEVESQNKSQPLDKALKIVAGVVLFLSCIYFLQIYILAQMVLSLVGGAILSACFFENVLKSQEKLNERLRLAARSSNLNDVKVLLERGADPFSRDNCDNDAIRHAFQNQPDAASIIEEILNHLSKPAPTLGDMIPGLSSFWGNNTDERKHFVEIWGAWFDALKAVCTHFSTQTREQFLNGTVQVFHLYTPLLPRMVNALILYLRHKTAYPNPFKEGVSSYYTDHLRLLMLDEAHLSKIVQSLANGDQRSKAPLPVKTALGWTQIAGVGAVLTYLAPSLVAASKVRDAATVVDAEPVTRESPTP